MAGDASPVAIWDKKGVESIAVKDWRLPVLPAFPGTLRTYHTAVVLDKAFDICLLRMGIRIYSGKGKKTLSG